MPDILKKDLIQMDSNSRKNLLDVLYEYQIALKKAQTKAYGEIKCLKTRTDSVSQPLPKMVFTGSIANTVGSLISTHVSFTLGTSPTPAPSTRMSLTRRLIASRKKPLPRLLHQLKLKSLEEQMDPLLLDQTGNSSD